MKPVFSGVALEAAIIKSPSFSLSSSSTTTIISPFAIASIAFSILSNFIVLNYLWLWFIKLFAKFSYRFLNFKVNTPGSPLPIIFLSIEITGITNTDALV